MRRGRTLLIYHIELRQFPHNLCRFNLSEKELQALVVPWAQERFIELGERKWSPHQARLTILEGPELALAELSMGRGWRNAQRHCEDVTERVLERARDTTAPAHGEAGARRGAATSAPPGSQTPLATGAERELIVDSLGLELLALVERGPAPLSRAWQLARARLPEQPSSESLALAEGAVATLLERRLIALESKAHGPLDESDAQNALRAAESWLDAPERSEVRMRRP